MFPAQALEHGAEAADSDEEEEAEPAEPTYVQEQQDLKRSFLQAGHYCCIAPGHAHGNNGVCLWYFAVSLLTPCLQPLLLGT